MMRTVSYRYLCDKYDTAHKVLPQLGSAQRYRVLQWVHAAEATFALHGLSILYARWFQKGGDVSATEAGMAGNVGKDMDYLEAELGKSSGAFLFGDKPTAADIMMAFSAQFILARELGTKGKEWKGVNAWLKACEGTESYKRAVEKTGHQL